MISATTTHLLRPQVHVHHSLDTARQRGGKAENGESLSRISKPWQHAVSWGSHQPSSHAGSLKNLCPGQKAILYSEIRVNCPKAGGERECQAQDSAERLPNPNQSCWLCSYGLLKSTVNLTHSQRPGNLQMKATSQQHCLSHPWNRSRDTNGYL